MEALAPLRAFGEARLAQGLAAAGRIQAVLVGAGLLSPDVDARLPIAVACYVCWWLLKMTVLRRLLPWLWSCCQRVPALHVPLTPDEADASPTGRKWVRALPSGRPARRSRRAARRVPPRTACVQQHAPATRICNRIGQQRCRCFALAHARLLRLQFCAAQPDAAPPRCRQDPSAPLPTDYIPCYDPATLELLGDGRAHVDTKAEARRRLLRV
jgi:hypothetical protein